MTREDFSVLALSYLEDIAAFSRRLTGNAADADDLVQATFERAFEAWRRLRDPAACRAWLFRIARNLFLDGRRTSAVRSQLSLATDSKMSTQAFIVPAEAVERLAARELEAALDRLPREQREALLLCDLWGFQYAEISEIVGSPIGTVRSRIARARGRLSVLLGRTAGEAEDPSRR
ncbi:MAG TPA: sigma-70 family RNA polymerase sigma factor [Thermoanaerobaculia bacterium]